ncbi:MAG: helix-turn-helix domain-containing protein [Catenulispora sp.]|nr:helix-turn-helix domain-containing protein [Catenulispora sp.]
MEIARGAAGESTWEVAWTAPVPATGAGVYRYHGFRMDLAQARRRVELPAVIASLVVMFGGELSTGAAGKNARGRGAGGPVGAGAGIGAEAGVRNRPGNSTGNGTGTEDAAGAEILRPFRALLCGPQTRVHVGQHSGRLAGVDVTMAPWAAYALFGTSMQDIADRAVDLSDVVGSGHRGLMERLGAAPGWRARFDAVDDFLGSRRAPGVEPATQVMRAYELMRRSGGTMPIAEVAAHVGWDSRRLQRAFAAQIGVRPKVASRILRLQRALRLLLAGVSLSRVAYECSYFDQAHLTNDITELTGRSPRRLLAERAAMPAGPPNVDRLPGEVTSIVIDPVPGAARRFSPRQRAAAA